MVIMLGTIDSEQPDGTPAAFEETELATGRAPGASNPAPDSGGDDDFDSFLAAVASAPAPYRPPKLEPGDRFAGRYHVERQLGQGGMGTVYLARDDELERNVALKLAGAQSSEAQLARLQQEARVMASMTAPGIVTVFEAGEHEGHVFIAMEFVPGGTLRDWMDLEPRPWREVLSMFLPIGRALAAAHEQGVVHRDFKPTNVLLTTRGEPKIADFGLARLADPAPGAASPVGRSLTLTTTGAVMGTPAYMAPEQFAGQPAESASDQFSFCVSLFEALHGTRPFRGETLSELMTAVEEGRSVSPDGSLPRRLAAAIRRGLRPAAPDRHSSMAALVAEIDAVLQARKRRAWSSVIGGGLAVAAVSGFVSARSIEEDPCDRDRIAELLSATWSEPVQQSLEATLGGSLTSSLQSFADELLDARVDACRAHVLERTMSDEDFALTARCLDRVQGRLAGLVSVLTRDPGAHAPGLVERTLPLVDSCEDLAHLRRLSNRFATRSSRDSAEADEAYDAIVPLFAQAQAELLNDDPRALETAEDLLEAARRHRFAGLETRALLLIATSTEDLEERARTLEAAAKAASVAAEPDLLADVAFSQARTALQRGELAGARLHLEYGTQLLELDPRVADRALSAMRRAIAAAMLSNAEGLYHEAARTARAALERMSVANPDRPTVLNVLGNALHGAGELADAERAYREALEHPQARSGEFEFGLNLNLGIVRESRGDLDGAGDAFEAASAAIERMKEPSPLLASKLLNNRGRLARHRGELESALQLQQRARSVLEAELPDHPDLAYVFDELGELQRRAGDLEAAQAALAHAGELRDAVYGPDNLYVSETILRLGRVFLDQDRPERAMAAARKSLELVEAFEQPPWTRATRQFLMARAIRRMGDASRADELAAQARSSCADSERFECRELERRIDRWARSEARDQAP